MTPSLMYVRASESKEIEVLHVKRHKDVKLDDSKTEAEEIPVTEEQ